MTIKRKYSLYLVSCHSFFINLMTYLLLLRNHKFSGGNAILNSNQMGLTARGDVTLSLLIPQHIYFSSLRSRHRFVTDQQ